MGQYFTFYNKSRNNKKSNIGLPFNFGLPWTKMSGYDDKEITVMFKYVIKNNKWSESDEVVANGDYGDTFRWYDYR